MPKGNNGTSYIEHLARLFFVHTLKNEKVFYNHRPDWLKYETGNNLELDLFFPEMNFAIEVNGFQHELKENQKRDAFKLQKCKENGIYLLRVKQLRCLLIGRQRRVWEQQINRRLKISDVPHSLIEKIQYYQPKQLKFSRAVHAKIKREKMTTRYNEIQEREKAQNEARMALKAKMSVI
jgi:hypothetical protein